MHFDILLNTIWMYWCIRLLLRHGTRSALLNMYIATALRYSTEIKNTSPTRSMPFIAPYRRPLDWYPLPHLITRTQQVCLRMFAHLSPYTWSRSSQSSKYSSSCRGKPCTMNGSIVHCCQPFHSMKYSINVSTYCIKYSKRCPTDWMNYQCCWCWCRVLDLYHIPLYMECLN